MWIALGLAAYCVVSVIVGLILGPALRRRRLEQTRPVERGGAA